MTVVGISILVYLLMNIGLRDAIVPPLLISEYIRPVLPEITGSHPDIAGGQVWRLLTPMFLHFSIFHIVFNMLWTWELGRLIEWRQGAVWLVILMVITSLSSNLAQYFVDGPLFGGMSGVIYGLLGYVWIQGKTNPGFGIRLNPAIFNLMMGWFVLCWTGLLERFFGIGVANSAHTAGLVSGLLVGLAVSGIARLSGRRP